MTRAIDFPQFGKDNERYKCRFKKYPSQRLYYQSAPGYVGQDRFKIENVTPYGDINMATFDVLVQ